MTTNNSTILDNKDHLLRIIDFVLSQSKKMGATDAEADIGAGIGLSANVRKGVIDKLEYENEKAYRACQAIIEKKIMPKANQLHHIRHHPNSIFC